MESAERKKNPQIRRAKPTDYIEWDKPEGLHSSSIKSRWETEEKLWADVTI